MNREGEKPEMTEMVADKLNLEVNEDAGQGFTDKSLQLQSIRIWNNLDLWILDSGSEIIIAATMKGSLFTEKHAQELKKSMKNDFEGMKNEMKEALKKLTEEDFEEMKNDFERQKKEMKNKVHEDLKKVTEDNFDGMKGEIEGMKKIAEENYEKMKNDFERQKKEMKTDFEEMKNQLKGMKTSLKDRVH